MALPAAALVLALTMLLATPRVVTGTALDGVVENREPGAPHPWLGTNLMREPGDSAVEALLLEGTAVKVELDRSTDRFLRVVASREPGEKLAGYVPRDHVRLTGPARLAQDVSRLQPPAAVHAPAPLLTARPPGDAVGLSMMGGAEAARALARRETIQRWLEWLPVQAPNTLEALEEMDVLVSVLEELDGHDRKLAGRMGAVEKQIGSQAAELDRVREALRRNPPMPRAPPRTGADATHAAVLPDPSVKRLTERVASAEERIRQLERVVELLRKTCGAPPAAATPADPDACVDLESAKLAADSDR